MIGAPPTGRMGTMQKHFVWRLGVVAALTAAHPFEGIAQDAAARAASVLAEARKELGG